MMSAWYGMWMILDFKCDCIGQICTHMGKCCCLWFESLAEWRIIVVLEFGQTQIVVLTAMYSTCNPCILVLFHDYTYCKRKERWRGKQEKENQGREEKREGGREGEREGGGRGGGRREGGRGREGERGGGDQLTLSPWESSFSSTSRVWPETAPVHNMIITFITPQAPSILYQPLLPTSIYIGSSTNTIYVRFC